MTDLKACYAQEPLFRRVEEDSEALYRRQDCQTSGGLPGELCGTEDIAPKASGNFLLCEPPGNWRYEMVIIIKLFLRFSYFQHEVATEIGILPKPVAAAIAYGLDKKKEVDILVFDQGKEILDVSILSSENSILRVISTAVKKF